MQRYQDVSALDISQLEKSFNDDEKSNFSFKGGNGKDQEVIIEELKQDL